MRFAHPLGALILAASQHCSASPYLQLTDEATWTWTHEGVGSTPALVVDASWPNPAVIYGLNIKQSGTPTTPAVRVTANRDVIVVGCRGQYIARFLEMTAGGHCTQLSDREAVN